jgi:hypothetical protein
MKSKYTLRAIALLAICLSFFFTASAQRVEKAHMLGPNPCHEGTKLCLQEINKKISQVRAYVKHVKPGDPVEFNPQPDPPGDPDPWYRQGREAYKSLQENFASLSESSPWGHAKWTWSESQISAWKNSVSDAQAKLNNLALPAFGRNRASINQTLNSLSASVQRLSGMIDNRSR